MTRRVWSWLLVLTTVGCVDVIVVPQPNQTPDVAVDHDMAADMPVDMSRDSGTDLGADASFDVGPDLPQELRADAGENVFGEIDEFVLLDGRASTGAVAYLWDFGNGMRWNEPRSTATANISYAESGRYQAVLTAFDANGASRTDSVVVTITEPVVHEPEQSSTVVAFGDQAAVVSPDSNEVLIVEEDGAGFDVVERLMTDREPRTITTWDDDRWLVVPCREDATVLYLRTNQTGEQRRVFLPLASQPFGVVASDRKIYVTLQATGELIEIESRGGVPTVSRTIDVIEDPRHLAVLPDGRFIVSRWRSPDAAAELAVVAPDLNDVQVWTLAVDPQQASDTEIGGLPSYLGAAAVSPNGLEAVVPSLQANIAHGTYLNGQPLTHESTIRAVASFIDLGTGVEQFERRKQWDDRGLANAAAFSPRGDFLYVAMRGNHTIERYDMLASTESGSILQVGFAIEGVAVSPDGRWLFADAMLSRELAIYDVRDLSTVPDPVERIPIPTAEPLDPELLRGKQLFNDAQDPRLTKDGYIACAHCHLDGDSDRRVWDFTDRGEGLRNTVSLIGRGGTANGPLHWSGNFDEIQDFEHDIRDAFQGFGLMDDIDLMTGTRSEPLGDTKAGISTDLDALAAYVASLDRHERSPFRTSTGGLTADAAAGALLFQSQGCAGCHTAPNFTDSTFTMPGVPLLHDVGTLGPGSGQRLGAPLTGIDTPTLRGVWNSPPYLHDGSAATLEEVVTTRNLTDAHGVTSTLDATQIAQLVEYLSSLDYRD